MSRLTPVLLAVLALPAAVIVPACSAAPEGAIAVESGSRTDSLTAAKLATLPQVQMTYKDRPYAGPKLREALLSLGIAAGVDVEVVGADGYKKTVDAATVAREDVILAIDVPAPEGPLRLIVPDSPGLSVRNVVTLRTTPAASP